MCHTVFRVEDGMASKDPAQHKAMHKRFGFPSVLPPVVFIAAAGLGGVLQFKGFMEKNYKL